MTDDEARDLAKQARELEWRTRYAARIQAVTGCTDEFAREHANVCDLDTFYSVDDDPEDAADDEMTEWTTDYS